MSQYNQLWNMLRSQVNGTNKILHDADWVEAWLTIYNDDAVCTFVFNVDGSLKRIELTSKAYSE